MQIEQLLVRNFRNYEEAVVDWHPEINLITGLNGQGKSNLIEACCYFSLASSYRDSSDMDLIGWEKPFFFLAARLKGRDPLCGGEETEMEMSVGFTREKRKLWKVNGKPQKKTSQVLGRLQTVIFSPEDLSLVKAGPSLRRKFLNRELLQLEKDFYPAYSGYRQSVEQRNKYLKQQYGHVDLDLLGVWDEKIAQYGSILACKRYRLLRELTPFAQKIHHLLSNGKENLTVCYEGAFFTRKEEAGDFWRQVADVREEEQQKLLQQQIADALVKNRREDLCKGTTGVGPHRDDIALGMNGISARQFASQGQQRTIALALKLAEIDLFYQRTGVYPVLLLDDVMSELDETRCKLLLEFVKGKTQTMITSTELDHFARYGKIIKIDRGKIK